MAPLSKAVYRLIHDGIDPHNPVSVRVDIRALRPTVLQRFFPMIWGRPTLVRMLFCPTPRLPNPTLLLPPWFLDPLSLSSPRRLPTNWE